MAATYDEMLRRLASRCSLAELCVADIERKLDATDLTGDERQRLLRQLISEGYVNNNRYAHAFVRDKFRFSGWGRVKIAQGLRAKQIPAADSRNDQVALDLRMHLRRETDAIAALLRDAIRAKRPSVRGTSDYEINGKLIRFALGRGFEMEVIMKELSMPDAD